MASEVVRQGRAAWARLKRADRQSWDEWLLVGYAMLEGRALTSRAYSGRPIRDGRLAAFSDWLIDNRLDLRADTRSQILTVMDMLPTIEAFRATLTETRRQRLTCPKSVLSAYRKAMTAGAPAPVDLSPTSRAAR
jgi:hypothetical protein